MTASTIDPASTPPPAAAIESTRPGSQGLTDWDPSREFLEAWACACGVWGAYFVRVATATSPAAVYDAGAQLVTDSLDICTRTAGLRLRDGGLRAPLLNDA